MHVTISASTIDVGYGNREQRKRERTIASRRTMEYYVAGVQRWMSKKGFVTIAITAMPVHNGPMVSCFSIYRISYL